MTRTTTSMSATVAGLRRRLRSTVSAVSARGGAGQARTDLVEQTRRADEATAEVQRVREELKLTRASVRDPFPDLALTERVEEVIRGVRAEALSYLSEENLGALAKAAQHADRMQHEGEIIECGTALGGSAIVMAAAKATDRPMRVFDVFGMIPAPGEADGPDVQQRYERISAGQAKGVGGSTYYGYRDNLYDEVAASFARHGVETAAQHVDLVRGLFEDTVQVDGPVALAHLDGDWYDSTMVCLERVAPALVRGGRIVIDDYYKWSGCRDAVNDYFSGRTGYALERRAKVHVVRR